MEPIKKVLQNIPDPEVETGEVKEAPKPLKIQWTPKLSAILESRDAIPLYPEQGNRDCSNCQGIGILMVFKIESGPYRFPPMVKSKWLDINRGSGWYIGETQTDFCPVCSSGRKQEILAANCGLSGQDRDISLQDFLYTDTVQQKAPARNAIAAFLGMNQNAHGLLTLWGSYGVGKSLLMKALVNGMIGIDVSARYITLSDLLAELREQYGENRGAAAVESSIMAYTNIQVLALDEIDRINMTDWAKETVFRLMDARYKKMDTHLTVLASNKAPHNFPAEFGYLVSRIGAGRVIEVPGPDMRKILKGV